MKVNLEQLEEMQKELFRQQCDLDIQKAMVKHFIKKEKAKQLTLTDVVRQSKQLFCYHEGSYTLNEDGTCCKCHRLPKPKAK